MRLDRTRDAQDIWAVRKFRQARHLQNLASTDELTGLAKRCALMAFANDAVERTHRDRATPTQTPR